MVARPAEITTGGKISEFTTPSPNRVGTTPEEITPRIGLMAKLSSRSAPGTSSLSGVSESTKVSPSVSESVETTPMAETKTKPQIETRPATITDTKTRIDDKVKSKLKLRIKLPTDDKSRLLDELGNPTSAIAWRMGKVGQNDVYYVVSAPFKSEKDVTIFVGKLPEGVKVSAGGEDSARKSIQILTGKAPAKLSIGIGAMDGYITGKPLNIKFRADPKQRVRTDITVRKGQVRVIKGLKLSR